MHYAYTGIPQSELDRRLFTLLMVDPDAPDPKHPTNVSVAFRPLAWIVNCQLPGMYLSLWAPGMQHCLRAAFKLTGHCGSSHCTYV